MAESGESSYWCVGGASARVLGGYDGFDVWTVNAGVIASGDQQAFVSAHEHLHHVLQHVTPWGLTARFAADLARLGVRADQFRMLFRFCRERSRRVHETFATTLTLGGSAHAPDVLHENAEYQDYFSTGMRLTGGLGWARGGPAAAAALQAFMCPQDLVHALDRGLAGLRLSDLDRPQARPDDRMAAALAAELPRAIGELFGEGAAGGDLAAHHDRLAEHLTGLGLPTAPAAAVNALIERLFCDVAALSPQLAERLTATAAEDDRLLDRAEDMQREAIELHHTGRLPVEVVPMEQLGARAADFVRDDEQFGPHVLLVLVRADLLARQFAGADALADRGGTVLALQAAGYDDAGAPIARLGVFDGVQPRDVVRAFPLPVVFVTTAASIADAPEDLRGNGAGVVFAVVDQPVVAQLQHTFARGARVAWSTRTVRGDRSLEVLAFLVDALPGVVWLHVTGAAGLAAVTDWLGSQPAAEHRPEAFDDVTVRIGVVVQHLVGAWFVVDQLGGRTT